MRRPAPLLSQVLAVNTALVTATVFAASLAARFDLSAAAERRQFLVFAAGILATVLANGLILRRRFRPLDQLVATMGRVDLARPGLRAAATSHEPRDVADLREAFNRMLARLEEERARGAHAVLRAQEAERARLARDLHDEVNQALTAILLRLQASSVDAPEALRTELAETRRLAQRAMGELLRLARELRPAALDDLGLVPALRSQVEEFGRSAGLAASFAAGEPLPALGADRQLVVYRVVQEGLSNVAQHAAATAVRVTLEPAADERARVAISDDGRGFDGTPAAGGGLAGMRERALLVGARLEVRSAAGRGTTVELTL